MPDRIARVWNGSSWEIITSTAAAPTAVANYQVSAPSSPTTGQVWINSSTRQFSVWDGSAWIAAVTTFSYQSTAPTSPSTGQVWVDSDDGRIYVWGGSAWIPANNISYQSLAPSSPITGNMWVDSDDNKFYVWNGSSWSSIGGGASGGGGDQVFYENGNTVTSNYTISTGKNAVSAGPITINNGITVTISNGSAWSIV